MFSSGVKQILYICYLLLGSGLSQVYYLGILYLASSTLMLSDFVLVSRSILEEDIL